MKILTLVVFFAIALATLTAASSIDEDSHGHHHHHHKHHKHHHRHHQHHHAKRPVAGPTGKAADVTNPVKATVAIKAEPVVKAAIATQATKKTEDAIVEKMKKLEAKIAEKKMQANVMSQGSILVNAPLPADFNELFKQAVSFATGVDKTKVTVTDTSPTKEDVSVIQVTFTAPSKIVETVKDDATNPDSKLVNTKLRPFLVAEDDVRSGATSFAVRKPDDAGAESPVAAPVEEKAIEATPVEEKGIDIDTAMPYGDLEPFGREDTAQELTESSVRESDSMVDQLERAEVAEEKRAVFRALTRLRGAAITSFDGVARSQTGNIDEYNKIHQWRKTHPLHHLADEESDVSKWAFPDNADF